MGLAAPLPYRALHEGIVALPHGLLWLDATATLVGADAHLGYEEAIGCALPLWSSERTKEILVRVVRATRARELVLLGDVVHAPTMSEGAANAIAGVLAALREHVELVVVAGNHEGRGRGRTLLGETVEYAERSGWVLAHGDKPVQGKLRLIAGHLHPSLPLGGRQSAPAFLSCQNLVVVPALTPYSRGLNVLSDECANAIRRLGADPAHAGVVACTATQVYDFGPLATLRSTLASAP